MKTWTLDKFGLCAIVSADDINQAIQQLASNDIPGIQGVDLIPLPTHHRHVRVLDNDETLSQDEWDFICDFFKDYAQNCPDFDYHKPSSMDKDVWEDLTQRLLS